MPTYPWHQLRRRMPLWRRCRAWMTTRFILWRMRQQALLARRWCRFCGAPLLGMVQKRIGLCPTCD